MCAWLWYARSIIPVRTIGVMPRCMRDMGNRIHGSPGNVGGGAFVVANGVVS